MKRTVVANVDGQKIGRYSVAHDATASGKAPTDEQLCSVVRRSMRDAGVPDTRIARAHLSFDD